MLFAVATTNTGDVLSCIQVKMEPNTRALVPPSRPALCECFVQFINPQNAGATVSATERARLVRSSDSPTIPPKNTCIHLQQGQAPDCTDCLGCETLASPRDTDQCHTLWWRQLKISGFFRECALSNLQPFLKLFESADVVHCFADREEL